MQTGGPSRNIAHPASCARTRARRRAPCPRSATGSEALPGSALPGAGALGCDAKPARCASVPSLLPRLIENYVDILQMLAHEGARLRIVGVAGSPSCGVTTASSGYTGGRMRECEHAHVAGGACSWRSSWWSWSDEISPSRWKRSAIKEGTGSDS
jgi:hypothetical protein